MSYPDRVEIDDDAAGWGWSGGAASSTDQPNRMDLLTVVLHELGHQLGLNDLNSAEDEDSLMFWQLKPGASRRPSDYSISDASRTLNVDLEALAREQTDRSISMKMVPPDAPTPRHHKFDILFAEIADESERRRKRHS